MLSERLVADSPVSKEGSEQSMQSFVLVKKKVKMRKSAHAKPLKCESKSALVLLSSCDFQSSNSH